MQSDLPGMIATDDTEFTEKRVGLAAAASKKQGARRNDEESEAGRLGYRDNPVRRNKPKLRASGFVGAVT